MIEVSKKWCTTPAECAVCGKKFQVVYEGEIITDGESESWKLPTDFQCNQCGSFDMIWTDFKKDNEN